MQNLIKYLNITLITIVAGLSTASCSVPLNGTATYPMVNSVDLKLQKTFDLKLNIGRLKFSSKADVSENPIPATERIKSFDAFLTKNYNDPLALNSNPFGNGIVVKANYDPVSTTMTFPNVPYGGPYYAVIAAYDKEMTDTSRKNITFYDSTISSENKRWARSSNSVLIAASGVTYSDTNNKLKVTLKLDKSGSLGFEIVPVDGQVIGGTTVTEK